MKDIGGINFYSPIEEKINILSHAVGLILSIVALVLLVTYAHLHGDVWHIVSFSIFGTSLISLYAASTFYHCAKKPELRSRLKIIDHASIYVLIAGTYTPFTLVTLRGTIGWVIFGTSWGLALTGIVLKLFFTGKYDLFSTIMYVAGGISYTIGAGLYSIKKIKFNHAIFHMLVLIGSFCHFMSVFFYVLPGG
jgi:hemolysin III